MTVAARLRALLDTLTPMLSAPEPTPLTPPTPSTQVALPIEPTSKEPDPFRFEDWNDMQARSDIKTAQTWYVRYPGDLKLTAERIVNLTRLTVTFKARGYGQPDVRFLISDIEFIERVNLHYESRNDRHDHQDTHHG